MHDKNLIFTRVDSQNSHAIELKYNISHGKAVIVGLMAELKLTEYLKLSLPSARKNLENLLFQLEIKIDDHMEVDWMAIIHDKKISGGVMDFPVITNVGKAKLIKLSLKVLKNALQVVNNQ